MLYTSYFANLRNIDKDKYLIASICQFRPEWIDESIENWNLLAPDANTLLDYKNGVITEQEYTEQYIKKLDVMMDYLINEFNSICDRDVVMLCYEKPTDFCHRHLLASWLKRHGFDCEEFSAKTV